MEQTMHIYESLKHTTWECEYHVVFIPKCRLKALQAQLRRDLGPVFRDLAAQKKCKVEEGHRMPDHVHMLLSVPPKYSVSSVIGFIKGKSAIHTHAQINGSLTEVPAPGNLRRSKGDSLAAAATAGARARPGAAPVEPESSRDGAGAARLSDRGSVPGFLPQEPALAVSVWIQGPPPAAELVSQARPCPARKRAPARAGPGG